MIIICILSHHPHLFVHPLFQPGKHLFHFAAAHLVLFKVHVVEQFPRLFVGHVAAVACCHHEGAAQPVGLGRGKKAELQGGFQLVHQTFEHEVAVAEQVGEVGRLGEPGFQHLFLVLAEQQQAFQSGVLLCCRAGHQAAQGVRYYQVLFVRVQIEYAVLGRALCQ